MSEFTFEAVPLETPAPHTNLNPTGTAPPPFPENTTNSTSNSSSPRRTYVVRRRLVTSEICESVVIKSNRKRGIDDVVKDDMDMLIGGFSSASTSDSNPSKKRAQDDDASGNIIESRVFRRIKTISNKDLIQPQSSSSSTSKGSKRSRSNEDLYADPSIMLQTHTQILSCITQKKSKVSSNEYDVIALDASNTKSNFVTAVNMKVTTTAAPLPSAVSIPAPSSSNKPRGTPILPPNIRQIDDLLKSAFKSLNLAALIPALLSPTNYASYPTLASHCTAEGTSLHCCVYANDIKNLRILLASRKSGGCGCGVNDLDGDGRTASDLARIIMHEGMYDALVNVYGGEEVMRGVEEFDYDVFFYDEDEVVAADAKTSNTNDVVEVSGYFDAKTGDLVLDFGNDTGINDIENTNEEDYDSNSENFEGNDYPDDESLSGTDEDASEDEDTNLVLGLGDSSDSETDEIHAVNFRNRKPIGQGVGNVASSSSSNWNPTSGNGDDNEDYDAGDVGYGYNAGYYGKGQSGVDDGEEDREVYAYDPEFDDYER